MLEHFTDSAKERLIKATEEYANNIVREAIRIEESARLEGAKPDITDSFVKMAIISNSRDRKQNNKIKISKIIYGIAPILLGMMWPTIESFWKTELAFNTVYLVLFLIIFVIFIVVVIGNSTKEE